jgi:hypothetical protein
MGGLDGPYGTHEQLLWLLRDLLEFDQPGMQNEPYARRTSSRLRYSVWPDSLFTCNPDWTAYWLRAGTAHLSTATRIRPAHALITFAMPRLAIQKCPPRLPRALAVTVGPLRDIPAVTKLVPRPLPRSGLLAR